MVGRQDRHPPSPPIASRLSGHIPSWIFSPPWPPRYFSRSFRTLLPVIERVGEWCFCRVLRRVRLFVALVGMGDDIWWVDVDYGEEEPLEWYE
jgi:hypothetical protein